MRKAEQLEIIEKVVAAHMGPIAKSYLEAIKAMQDKVPLDELVTLIAQGRIQEAVELISNIVTAAGFMPLQGAINNAVIAGGTASAAIATSLLKPTPQALEIVFNALNPQTAIHIADYLVPLIQQVTEGQRRAIRQVLERGLANGTNPRRVAADIKAVIGLTEKMEQAVANFRAELDTFHLRDSAKNWNLGAKISRAPGGAQVFAHKDGTPIDGILERRLRDFRFDKTLIKTIENGIPLSDAQKDKMVAAYRRKYIRYRATNIARTEAIRAASIGAHELWLQQVAEGNIDPAIVKREWIYTKDKRTRSHHRSIPGLNRNGVGLSEPFQTEYGVLMYPGDPRGRAADTINCRCAVAYSLRADVMAAAA